MKEIEDSEIYNEYSDVVFKSFPFDGIIKEIQTLLKEAGLKRLVIFFDDYSELNILDQRLFVDVILSPLNNASNECVKLKIAGYPGRVYYGRIDPSKASTISLDFFDLYEAAEFQEMERSAVDYTNRLLETRFSAFEAPMDEYFDTSIADLNEYTTLLFQSSFNVPRIIGHILHQCYLDKVSKNQKITLAAIRLAAKKYYEGTILQYFDRMNRYALEPFERKLDRHNQNQLLMHMVKEMRSVRKGIVDGSIGGGYFKGLRTPPTSHFIVSKELESVLSSLEANFFISKYKNMRDKTGKKVSVYAMFLGLTESERMSWGYPLGRHFRNYFVQRCFDFTRTVHEYLSSNQTIRCGRCGHCFPLEQKVSLELYKWKCPECTEGVCTIVSLSDDFRQEVESLKKEIMLEPVELEILTTLEQENRKMRAGEVASLIDNTHQLVGRRTSKLQDMGLVQKDRDEDSKMRSEITERAIKTYFTE
jgi:DNA-binding transcriptional ArsR family regulator